METEMTPVGELASLIFATEKLAAVNLSLREGSTACDLFALCLDLFMAGVLMLRGADRCALHEITMEDFESVRDAMKVLGVLACLRTEALGKPVTRAHTHVVRPGSPQSPLDKFRVVAFSDCMCYELWFEVFHHTAFASCASVKSVIM